MVVPEIPVIEVLCTKERPAAVTFETLAALVFAATTITPDPVVVVKETTTVAPDPALWLEPSNDKLFPAAATTGPPPTPVSIMSARSV